MGIYLGDKQGIAYKGDYKPVNIYLGHEKAAGWELSEKTGTELSWDDTYNDKVLLAVVEGRSEQVVTVQGKNLFDWRQAKVVDYKGVEQPDYGTIIDGVYTNQTSYYGASCHITLPIGTIVAGNTYTISFDVLAPVSQSIYFGVRNTEGTRTVTTKSVTAGVLTHMYMTVTAPAGYTYYQYIQLQGSTSVDYTNINVVFTNIQLELGSSATAYELFIPNSPSPDYPSPIKSVGTYNTDTMKYEIDVVSSGKNLFDKSIWSTPSTACGLTIQYLTNEDCFLLNGTANATQRFSPKYINLPAEKGSRYTLSNHYVSGSVDTSQATGSTAAVSYLGVNDNINQVLNWIDAGLQEYDISRIGICNYNYITNFWFYISQGIKFDNYKVKIQLEQSPTATPYEPFRGYHKTTISLDNPLRGLPDGTKDTYDAVTGQITRRVGFKVFDGTESLAIDTILTNTIRFGYYNLRVNPLMQSMYCTHFISPSGSTKDIEHCNNGGGNPSIFFWISKERLGIAETDTNVVILSKCQEWLDAQYAAGTPVTVQYKLAEPTIEQIDPLLLPTYPRYTTLNCSEQMAAKVRVVEK